MAYGIVVNVDYESYEYEICHLLWTEIKSKMLAAGFRLEGRTFVTDLGEDAACARAREVIASIEGRFKFQPRRISRYVKDFYGLPLDHRTDLLMASGAQPGRAGGDAEIRPL